MRFPTPTKPPGSLGLRRFDPFGRPRGVGVDTANNAADRPTLEIATLDPVILETAVKFTVQPIARPTETTRPTTSVGRTLGVARAGSSAFTLIEVLVVIGVIALLIAGLVFGAKYALDSMKAKSTKATLSSLQSVLDAGQTAGIFKKQPIGMYNRGVPSAPPNGWVFFGSYSSSVNRTPDFWRLPDYFTQLSVNTQPVVLNTLSYSATSLGVGAGAVTPDAIDSWSTTDAIRNTGIALAMLHGVPGAGTTLDGLPVSSNLVPTYWNATSTYSAGARVAYTPSSTSTGGTGTLIYVALANLPPNTQPTGVTDSNWKVSYGTVLDSWGNPIIFVPTSGIMVTANGTTKLIQSPSGNPFFASAGPDGNFAAGDDNLYSFDGN